ncbi:MAG: VirB3 family type IV secretion system protein [Litorimonas sp.]|uniref:Conjugal transfer protein TrbD n=1 Tax=Algimonas ampicilliniresistens TaxID=1298735 RepID=A0ABQ5VA14_9PROT|nr:VirB3 family type IV secretion system protein [Algimonas ampicilliniresistens]GLQ23852.1 conjugal transfer protein TrbD [Algimonas ampicilliniresistens]
MNTAQYIEGFSIPVHRSVTQPIMMAGAPRAATILNGTLATALGLGLQLLPVGIAVWVVAQTACVFAAKRDPLFLDVLRRHLRQKGYLA